MEFWGRMCCQTSPAFESTTAKKQLSYLTANSPEVLVQFDKFNRSRLARWSPFLLRLVIGFGFTIHGIAKLSRGPDSFAGILHSLGVPAPYSMAWITILTELLGGIAIGLGAFVTSVSVPLAAILLVAIFTVHLPYGFSSIKLIAVTPAGAQFGPPGYECDLLYLAALAALVLGGPGPLAIDGLLSRKKQGNSTLPARAAFLSGP